MKNASTVKAAFIYQLVSRKGDVVRVDLRLSFFQYGPKKRCYWKVDGVDDIPQQFCVFELLLLSLLDVIA